LLIFRRGDGVFLSKARAELELGTGKALTTGKEVRKCIRLVEILGIDFCMSVIWFMVVNRSVGVIGLAFIRVIEDVWFALRALIYRMPLQVLGTRVNMGGRGWLRIRP